MLEIDAVVLVSHGERSCGVCAGVDIDHGAQRQGSTAAVVEAVGIEQGHLQAEGIKPRAGVAHGLLVVGRELHGAAGRLRPVRVARQAIGVHAIAQSC